MEKEMNREPLKLWKYRSGVINREGLNNDRQLNSGPVEVHLGNCEEGKRGESYSSLSE